MDDASVTRRAEREDQKKAERSIFVPRWMRELLPDLKGCRLSVFIAYSSFANHRNGRAWPSIPYLCRVTGYGVNAVKSARRFLVSRSLLKKIEQERGSNHQFGRAIFEVALRRGTVYVPRSRGTVYGRPKSGCTGKRPTEKSARKVLEVDKVAPNEKVRTDESRTHTPTDIAAMIKAGAGDGPFADMIDHDDSQIPWMKDALACAAAIGYTIEQQSPVVSANFVSALYEAWEQQGAERLSARILAEKVTGLCRSNDPSFRTPLPPDFQELTDRLQEGA